MAGRRPKTYIDTDRNHMPKAEQEARANATPVYQSQEFKAPDTLTAKEREVWDWLVKIFRETTNCMVSDADVHLMELYCRAEVAERALKIAATRLKCYGGLGEGFCGVSDCEYRHCGNDEGCVLAHLRKAAREIEEERK